MYLHDGPTMLRIVLLGELTGDRVAGVRHAWITAQSILGTKELVVDVSGITIADTAGLELLSEMRESGARLIVAPAQRQASAIARLVSAVRRAAGWKC